MNNHNMESIHPEDRSIEGLGIVECLNEQDDYIILKEKQNAIRAKVEGVSKVSPTPTFK